MYYPYLRGRQFELLALRDFAENLKGGESHVFPIIEPVRRNKNALKKAAITMSENGMQYGIILNPENGECASEIIDFKVENDFPNPENWAPTFIVNSNNVHQIEQIIGLNNYDGVILILLKTSSVSDDEIIALIQNSHVSKIITDSPRRRIKSIVLSLGKEIISLTDNFEAKPKNAAYLEIEEELFSEEFAYYSQDGYSGFSDYTVIPNEFRDGGALPNVVAIHLTYQKQEDQIFVRHFCSRRNIDDHSNIQGKFGEAASYAISFFDSNPAENSIAIDILRNYISVDGFPGLGMLKKISILHHILLIQRILN